MGDGEQGMSCSSSEGPGTQEYDLLETSQRPFTFTHLQQVPKDILSPLTVSALTGSFRRGRG